jgi:cytochrome P450
MFVVFFLALLGVLAVLDFINVNWGWKGDWRWPFLRDLVTTLREFNRFHDYAYETLEKLKMDHVTWKLGFYDVLVVTNPEDVKHLLKDNWKNYVVAQGLRGDALEDLLGNGIFHADGHHWFVQRKHASREFSANIFRTFMTMEFVEQTNKLASLIRRQEGNVIDLHGLFFRLTLDAFGKIAFGLKFGGLDGSPIPFAAAFDRAQELSAQRIAQKPPFWWKMQRLLRVPGAEGEMRQCLAVINQFVTKLVADRRKAPELASKEDLLSKLMMASEADKEIDPTDRDRYLRDMTINFIIAGRDTTACALSWFFYEMTKNPQAEKKLVEELDLVLEGKPISFDTLAECQYLTACLSETLRLHPSVPFNPKTAVEADVFPCGARIAKGSSVAYLPYCMGRMKSIWGEDAHTFRPERWLNSEGVFVREDQCKFTAFQAGPRVCLGLDMAMLEMKVVVGTILPQFSFELLEEPHYRVGLVLQMRDGLKLRVRSRTGLQRK